MKRDQLIFGIHPVLEAVKSGKPIDKLFIQKGMAEDKINPILNELDLDAVSVNYVPVEKLDRLIRSNHQGIIASISPIVFQSLEETVESLIETKKDPIFLILDQVSDVRNFGAILRTAECTGVDAVVIQKKGGAPVSGDTVKTSAGAIFNIPICKVDHIKDAIFYLQGSGITTVAATEKANQSLYELDLTGGLALVMGSEGKGISKSVLSLVDHSASLPLLGNINSLNVSVACGVFLYEVVRQRIG
ncbi:23S rRNA (guanosine(2251)-2'-O)-methyltransferase RlmB [Aureitalea sp. L0-47]|uniref:23S rRNA (guanosine(2251)-2'-O)-methyltransferase RlmB n=1 Tax=Aureitalea sp. L0-47 TaxID=2816962 RepID=UPI002237C711|nr:23S rRNA (guanosine(2251)-2'-O)-methyltransferase RlmB [Aureitalea sp. L0-47]MCW5520137.1 23S rRNA (guanosine(2251)-2'-O)-methyltransferase RlmB [Aureitalea sp. L0-47]